jgi:hypothetical protein
MDIVSAWLLVSVMVCFRYGMLELNLKHGER